MICSEWIRLIETIIDMLIQHCSGWSSLSRNWNHILIMRIVKNNTECYFITARPHCLYHNVISLFSANQHPPSAVNVTRYSHLLLSAGHYSTTPAAGDRYLLLVWRSAANPPTAVRPTAVDRWERRTDGRTLNPAPHTTIVRYEALCTYTVAGNAIRRCSPSSYVLCRKFSLLLQHTMRSVIFVKSRLVTGFFYRATLC